jgi:uncharacterized protein YidB (DUF937 family)
MGLLDSVVGMLGGAQGGPGGGNAALLNLVVSMLAGGGSAAGGGGGGLGGLGGLAGLIERFQQAGLGDQVGSWVSTGQNMPVNADQIGGALGPDILSQIASQLGLSPGDAAGQLSQVLPQVVDKLTPDGQVPSESTISDILGRFR